MSTDVKTADLPSLPTEIIKAIEARQAPARGAARSANAVGSPPNSFSLLNGAKTILFEDTKGRESISPKAQRLFCQARDAFFAGEWGDAISSLKKLIRFADQDDEIARDWTHTSAHRNLGLMHAQLSDFGLAAEHLERALELGAEKDAAVCHSLGCSYRIVGRFEEAREMLREAIRLNENDTLARYVLITSCIELSRLYDDDSELIEAWKQSCILDDILPRHLAFEFSSWL
jgi:tetratricopeptide (TPR) repeat protein